MGCEAWESSNSTAPLCSTVLPAAARIVLQGFHVYSRRHTDGTCRKDAYNFCGNEGWEEEWPKSFKKVFPDADVVLLDYSYALPRKYRLSRPIPILLAANGSYRVVADEFVWSAPVDLYVARSAANIGYSEFHKAPTEERIQDIMSFVVLNRSSSSSVHTAGKLKRILFPGTISPHKGQLKFLSSILSVPGGNVSWLKDFEFVFVGKEVEGSDSYWHDIKKLLKRKGLKYQEPRVYYGLDYTEALCDPSNIAAIFWSLMDYNPRSVYEALYCNLPVFVSAEAHSAEGLNSTVGRILSIESDSSTLVRNFKEFLDTDWGDLPFQYAVKHMNNQREFRRFLSKLVGSEIPCQF
eukprot:gene27417-33116_t